MTSYKLNTYLKFIFTALITIVLLGCNSAKRVIESGEVSDKLNAKQVIKQHQKSDTEFKTLQAKVRIDLIQGESEQGYTFNFRMEKDKVIWISAPLGLARMMITPQSVKFYNKSDNTYFDGSYALLSDFVGFDLDFFKVQNILLGQAIYDFKIQPYDVSTNEESYVLFPKDQDVLLELFYLVNPSHFKMDSIQLAQQSTRRFLQVDYASYQKVDKQILPKDIEIVAVEDADQVAVKMDFKSVSLNEEVRFPFNIPKGYKEITLD